MPSPYLPNTDAERMAMLREIGVGSIEELFQGKKLRLRNNKRDFADVEVGDKLGQAGQGQPPRLIFRFCFSNEDWF